MAEVSAPSALEQITLDLQGLHCAGCREVIESLVGRLPGVESVRVNLGSRQARIHWDARLTPLLQILGALQQGGYGAAPASSRGAVEARRQERRDALWRLFVAGFCGMQVMMLATPSYVAGSGDLSPDLARLLNWGQWVLALPVMVFSAHPFVVRAIRSVRMGQLSMDVPVVLGMLVMFIASSVATVLLDGPLGSVVVFDSLTMFITFLLGARWVEMGVRHRAARELELRLQGAEPRVLRLDDEGHGHWVDRDVLKPGDRIRVPVGSTFAADGLILRGTTVVSESLMTGESLPVPREPGQGVLAGSLNAGAPVDVCITALGDDTRLHRLVRMAEDAAADRPSLQRMTDQWAKPFLWGVLGLAAVAAGVWHWIDPTRAVWVAVSVLVVTCPCALSLAAPATVVAAARGMLRDGVLLQRLGAIEDLARVDHLVFDKTGTLTEDTLGLRRIQTDRAPDDALGLAASLAAWSTHPAARALVEEAQAHAGHGMSPAAWREVNERPGCGLQARDAAGRSWRLGRPGWAGSAGSPVADGAIAVVLGCEGRTVATFELADRLRRQAQVAVEAARAQGVAVSVLSGDAGARVHQVADHLSVQVLAADARPDHKIRAVQALQAQGHVVAMVGDGVNDAPVLAQAQVSFAMGHGSSASQAHADAVVLGSDPLAVSKAMARARLAQRLIRQNLTWALIYNLAAVPLALLGWLPPWAAGLGMALSSMGVVLNAARADRRRVG